MIRTRNAPWYAAVTAAIAGAVALAACTPLPPGGGSATTTSTSTTTTIATPASPVISSFSVAGGVGPAPSVVALTWSVFDPNGDALTCRIDGDGDGTAEIVVNNCPATGSRNVSLPTAGSVTAELEIDDATSAPVTAAAPITVPAGTSESFDIVLRGVSGLTPTQAAAFTSAEARWEGAIVRGTLDTNTSPRPSCLPATSADLPSPIDDLIIDVSVVAIDGPGGILGQAGPNCINSSSELAAFGIMQFDQADVANLIAAGSFSTVILHEMGHVLGIGTLWDLATGGFGTRKVITGAGGPDPRYTGPRGIAEWSTLGGTSSIPLETTGGAGTRDSHWSEAVFDNEIMTGYIDNGVNPLSATTLASLADLGYRVDLSVADAYSLPGGGSLRLAPFVANSVDAEVGEVLRPPIGSI